MVNSVKKLADKFQGKGTPTKRNMSVNDFANYFDSQLSYNKFLDRAQGSAISSYAEGLVADAARRPKGQTMSTKQMRKAWQKHKDEYHSCKKDLSRLESDQESLDTKVEEMRKKLFEARKGMLDKSRALEKADLAGASHSKFYDSGDVSFIVDKEEYHLESDDSGEYNLLDMKEYLKNKKKDSALVNDDDDDKEDEAQMADDVNYMMHGTSGGDPSESPDDRYLSGLAEENPSMADDSSFADDGFYDNWLKEFQELDLDL